jgi:hypothetical protein
VSAAQALRAARAAGIHIEVEDDDLLLEASEPPPTAVLDQLSRHKPEIVRLLRPVKDGWSAEDWRLYFEDRAAVAEFDGGLPRERAEAQAFECCIAEWLDRNPVPSSPGHCASCGRSETYAPIVPHGTEPEIHWLHRECRSEWKEKRRSQAEESLTRMRVRDPSDGSGDYTHSAPRKVQDAVVVRCQHCGHEAGLSRDALGLGPESPVSAFVKRLRCSKCGSRNVTANDPTDI